MPFSSAVHVNPPTPLVRGREYPFVAMAALNPGLRCAYSPERRAFDGGGSRFMPGDTLMARITPCLENGKIARYCGYGNEPAHGSTEFIVVRGRAGVSDAAFAYYLTNWEGVTGYAISQMTGTSGRQRVPTYALDHLIVAVPPVGEQHGIALILGTLDDKIELNLRIGETLEAMARALFQSWFVDFDPVRAKAVGRDPGVPKPLADLFPARLVDSEIGEIPEGWEVKSLDQIARFLNGLALQKYSPDGGRSLPVIKIAQLRSGRTDGADRASADLDPNYIVADGDILFSWSGSLECVLWAGGPGALNQHLFKVMSSNWPRWFCYFAVHHHLADFRRIAAGKATTMGHIQRHHLSDAKIAVPSGSIPRGIDQLLSPLFESLWKRGVQSRTLARLRDVLLPELISGRLRVEDADRLIGGVI